MASVDQQKFDGRQIINPPLLSDILKIQSEYGQLGAALSFEGKEYSYGELDSLANMAANFFLLQGLTDGCRVAWIATNIDLFWPIFVGAAKAGVVLAPLNWRLSQGEIHEIFKDMAPSIVLAEPAFYAGAVEFVRSEDVPIFSIDDAFRVELEEHSNKDPDLTIISTAVILQLYTSGTTGLPKGVLLTHECFHEVTIAQHIVGVIKPENAGEAFLHLLPHFHIAGVTLGFMAWRQSMPVIQHREFDVSKILFEAKRGTALNAFFVPSMIDMVLKGATNANVSLENLVCVSYGATPMPNALLDRAIRQMPNAKFYQFYGMTETTGGLSVLGPEDHYLGSPALNSAGKPLPGCEVRIVDPATSGEVETGAVGEIFTRSKHVMLGYWNKSEMTDAVLIDGFYRSGDAGYQSESGHIFLVDRIKDMIISGGENIYPAELERALLKSEAVDQCAFYGVPDEKWGEVVCALVVPVDARKLEQSDVLEFLSGKIARFKMPRYVAFGAELPRNASGKVSKTALRADMMGREKNSASD